MKTISLFTSAILFPFCCVIAQDKEKLKDVTFGFAAGFSQNFSDVYEYSLSPANTTLQRQKINRGSFVISSMISIKLTKLEVENNELQSQKTDTRAGFKERFAINVGLNLIEISNSVQFNKSIDGGVGLGYYIQKNAQVSLMFEATSVRQIRAGIENGYLGKQIPKESAYYNALDKDDDNLFYNKYVAGLSLKIVFSL